MNRRQYRDISRDETLIKKKKVNAYLDTVVNPPETLTVYSRTYVGRTVDINAPGAFKESPNRVGIVHSLSNHICSVSVRVDH